MYGFLRLYAVATACISASAHLVLTYPGWRGDNLHTNGTLPQDDPDALGINVLENGTRTYPYGMQWMYPCGGQAQGANVNRTKWPLGGGALSFQPGWFPGHSKALIYVNIGIQEQGMKAPPNYSHPVVPPFQILGPNNSYYPGQVCLPQVRMPANLSLAAGDLISIQVIETAQHGAALYSCVDVELVEPEDMPDNLTVTAQNCYNSTDIHFQSLFTSASLTAGAPISYGMSTVLVTALMAFWMVALL